MICANYSSDELAAFSAADVTLTCEECGGEGRIWKSKYGGNDPDVWDAGQCEECQGSGDRACSVRNCDDGATSINEDGEAMCEHCLSACEAVL